MNDKNKCRLCFYLACACLLTILIVIICDEPKIIDENKDIKVYWEQSNDTTKLNYQIEYLSQINTSSQSLLNRKENAAWAAFALYLSGLVLFFSSLKNFRNTKCCKKILASLLLLLIAVCVFAFIHAQYSSIYDTIAKAHASNYQILQ